VFIEDMWYSPEKYLPEESVYKMDEEQGMREETLQKRVGRERPG
jgi:hypothetical protein